MSLGLGIRMTKGGIADESILPSGEFSVSFDGTADWVEVSHHATLNITSNLTVSAWVKTSVDTQQTIISKGDSSSEDTWYVESGADGNGYIRAGVQNGSDYILENGTADISDNAWHNVVAVINKDATLVYVDGALQNGSATTAGSETSTMANSSSIYFGQRVHSGNGRYWNGSMDDVAIWNVVLDADSIAKVYNSGTKFDLMEDAGDYDNSGDLVSFWRLNTGTGVSALDSEGSNNGTLNGNVAWVED